MADELQRKIERFREMRELELGASDNEFSEMARPSDYIELDTLLALIAEMKKAPPFENRFGDFQLGRVQFYRREGWDKFADTLTEAVEGKK